MLINNTCEKSLIGKLRDNCEDIFNSKSLSGYNLYQYINFKISDLYVLSNSNDCSFPNMNLIDCFEKWAKEKTFKIQKNTFEFKEASIAAKKILKVTRKLDSLDFYYKNCIKIFNNDFLLIQEPSVLTFIIYDSIIPLLLGQNCSNMAKIFALSILNDSWDQNCTEILSLCSMLKLFCSGA